MTVNFGVYVDKNNCCEKTKNIASCHKCSSKNAPKPLDHHWTKEKFQINRKNFYNKEFFKDTRNIPNPIIDRLTPIEGKLGTIIIFNTDCIHHQGIVKSGEACIVRSHYSREAFNKKFRIKNYLKKFF